MCRWIVRNCIRYTYLYTNSNTMALVVGSQGDRVIKLQQRLNIKADGYYGSKTKEAVRNWQRANKLPVTGVVELDMWDRLFESF